MEPSTNNGYTASASSDFVLTNHQEEPTGKEQTHPSLQASTNSQETTKTPIDGKGKEEEAQESETPETDSKTQPGDNYESSFFTKLEALIKNADPTAPSFFAKDKSISPIGRLVNLGRKLSEIDSNAILYRQAAYAADLISKGGSCLPHALTIIDDIDFSTSKNSPVHVVMKGVVDALKILVFLFGSFIMGTLLLILPSTIFSYDQVYYLIREFVGNLVNDIIFTPIFLSALFGILGSIVSIILRLSEFERSSRKSRQFLRMTGMLLPIVGGVFAIVSCAIYRSNVISFLSSASINKDNEIYFYIVIGFLSGFSERFTRSLLVSLEDLTATRRQQQTTVDPSSGVTKTDEKIVEVHKTKS